MELKYSMILERKFNYIFIDLEMYMSYLLYCIILKENS